MLHCLLLNRFTEFSFLETFIPRSKSSRIGTFAPGSESYMKFRSHAVRPMTYSENGEKPLYYNVLVYKKLMNCLELYCVLTVFSNKLFCSGIAFLL